MVSIEERTELPLIGGEEAVRKLVDIFYGKVAENPVLSPLFPDDLEPVKQKQFEYFVEVFGGEKLYSEKHGKPFLRFKHRHVTIGLAERDAWMGLLVESLSEMNVPDELAKHITDRFAPIADAMINHHPKIKDSFYFKDK